MHVRTVLRAEFAGALPDVTTIRFVCTFDRRSRSVPRKACHRLYFVETKLGQGSGMTCWDNTHAPNCTLPACRVDRRQRGHKHRSPCSPTCKPVACRARVRTRKVVSHLSPSQHRRSL